MRPVLLLIAVFFFGHCGFTQQINLVKDIAPGLYNGCGPNFLGTLNNGKVLFSCDYPGYGRELWITNGTEAGTKMVKDINKGVMGSMGYVDYSIVYNGKLFFFARDTLHGVELWLSNGTDTGTYLVKDIFPGPGANGQDAQWREFFEYKGKIYFNATNGVDGEELWVTDGTKSGTYMLKNISLGWSHSSPEDFIAAYGKLYFTTGDGVWFTDGTDTGTHKLSVNIPSQYVVRQLCLVFNNNLILVANDANYTEYRVYSFDGTNASLIDSYSHIYGRFMVAANKLFYIASNSISYGIYATDGTDTGTRRLLKIESTGSPNYLLGEVNGKLVFSYYTFNYGDELWVSDGIQQGTLMLTDTQAGVNGYNGYIFCHGQWDNQSGINHVYKGNYYFVYDTGNHDKQLWMTDGTLQGTKLLSVIYPFGNNSDVVGMYIFNDRIWLDADNSVDGREPYLYGTLIPDGVNNSSSLTRYSIYPNPNKGNFVLKLDNNNFQNGYLRVIDMMGRQIHGQEINNKNMLVDVTLHNVPSGIFRIILQLDENVMAQNIIIE